MRGLCTRTVESDSQSDFSLGVTDHSVTQAERKRCCHGLRLAYLRSAGQPVLRTVGRVERGFLIDPERPFPINDYRLVKIDQPLPCAQGRGMGMGFDALSLAAGVNSRGMFVLGAHSIFCFYLSLFVSRCLISANGCIPLFSLPE